MIKAWLLKILILLLCAHTTLSQDTAKAVTSRITLSGVVDVFYSYVIPPPEKNRFFLYSYNRHNEFNLNLGFLKLSVAQTRYRANLTLQAGTYPNDNYLSEPGLLKNIFEANTGISLNEKGTVWIDAGIFASHIGFESAIAFDNWTLTRSLLAENSPYYLSGIKFTNIPNDKWTMLFILCNGWQRIKRIESSGMLSVGTQIKFSPGTKSSFNWSTFSGTDDPDSIRRIRYFNNFYGQFQLSNHVGMIVGFDVGIQQKLKNTNLFDGWFSPVIMVRYSLSEKWKLACRVESYRDKAGVIINTGLKGGFSVTGVSCNADYSPAENILCRIEGRWLHGTNSRDENNKQEFCDVVMLTTSMAVRLN